MIIRFYPEKSESGTVSFCAWDNPELPDLFRRLFGERLPREEIVMIDITKEGIRAYFQFRESSMENDYANRHTPPAGR